MSQSARERARNAQHTIADKQHKQQQTNTKPSRRTQTASKQPSGTATRAAKRPTKNKETPQPHQPGTVTGFPVIAYATNATTPSNHTPHGVRSLAARNALITAQPQVKGNHHEHTPTGARPPRRRGEPSRRSQDEEKIRAPARVSQARRERPADNTRDSSGQQGTRTPPTQCERTD